MNPLWVILLCTSILYAYWYDATFWLLYAIVLVGYTVFYLATKEHNSSRKAIMISTWDGKSPHTVVSVIALFVSVEASDPTSWIIEELNVTKALQHIALLNAEHPDVKVELHHVVGHGIAHGLHAIRRDVGRFVFGFFKHSPRIGSTFEVESDGVKRSITLWDAHKLSLVEFTKQYEQAIRDLKSTPDMNMHYASVLPTFLLQPFLLITSYITTNIGLPINYLCLAASPLGHFYVQDVGQYGMQQGYMPLTGHLRVMGVACTGKVRKVPVVVGDEIVVQDMMNSTQTGDHRFGDASIWLPMKKAYQGYVEDPAGWDPASVKANVHWTEKEAAAARK